MTLLQYRRRIAANLQRHRLAAKLSQTGLGRKAVVSQSLVNRLENAKGCPPNVSTLFRLAVALAIDPAELTNATPKVRG